MLLMVFTMHDVKFGIPLKEVVCVARDVSYIDTATASGHIRGTTILRDEIIPIYNLESKFGYNTFSQKDSFIVISYKNKKIAIEVEKIDGIKLMEEFVYADIPPLINNSEICLKYAVKFQDEIILVIDIEKIIMKE